MTVSKEKAREIMNELEPLISAVFARHGLDAPKFSSKYGPWIELKITGSELERGENGVNLNSPEAQYYSLFGYTTMMTPKGVIKLEAPLGTKFTVRGTTYVFAGIAPKRRKYPIYALNVDEGTYTFFQDGAAEIINDAARTSVA